MRQKKTVASHRCENPYCRKETSNKRFCSRSCAVSVTNGEFPRHRRRNYCLTCKAPIRPRRVYCEDCRAGGNDQLNLDLRTRQRIHTLAGAVIERDISDITLDKHYVYRCGGLGSHALSSVATCGELIDLVIAICCAPPEFLSAEAARRHTGFLLDLAAYEMGRISDPDRPPGPLAGAPLGWLNAALEEWVLSYLRRKNGTSLLAHFALDTGMLLVSLVNGASGRSPEWWEIEPLLRSSNSGFRFSSRIFDARFRKAFQKKSGFQAVARVPQGYAVYGDYGPVLVAGQDFRFLLDGSRDVSYRTDPPLLIKPPLPRPTFDIMPDLRFNGQIAIPMHPGAASVDHGFSLPWSWITHEIVGEGNDESHAPILRWNAAALPPEGDPARDVAAAGPPDGKAPGATGSA